MSAERVLITGTTSGIGRALLEHYAQRGAHVIAVNRRRVPELELEYPNTRFEWVDVRSSESVAALVRSLAESGELPEIFLLNAGINRVDNDESFQLSSYREVLDTNLFGVLSFVEPLTRLSAQQVARHVIVIGSLASYVGNPYGLGYTTSKQALSACFSAWAQMYAGTDLVFQHVLLGPVPTSIYTMADRFPAWMVWLKQQFSGTLSGSANAIASFARTRRHKLVYPRRALLLYLAMWLGQRLIPGFFRGRKTLAGSARRGAATEARTLEPSASTEIDHP